MTIRTYQVDSFADAPFTGNPAAVCCLDGDGDAEWMQRVAAEMNLSETAFVWPRSEGFGLRWFTPGAEVSLCGHATLATAHILWESGATDDEPIAFESASGQLLARRSGATIELDFPRRRVVAAPCPNGLLESMASAEVKLEWEGVAQGYGVLRVDSVDAVRALVPDLPRLAEVELSGVIVTAGGEGEFDFVSRFFAPALGVPEDPVTGSAHCALADYWGERLDRSEMVGRQLSARGGTVSVRLDGERVHLGGRAVTVWRGEWVG